MLKTVKLNGIMVGAFESDGDLERDAQISRAMLERRGLLKAFDRPLAIFSQANAFATTANYLYEAGLKTPSTAMTAHAAPFAVNAAFAIEMYLKALSEKHGKALRGHDLKHLHDALPPSALAAIDKAIPDAMAHQGVKQTPDLATILGALRHVFVRWRYSYEDDGASAPMLEIAPTILAMAVLHNAWQVDP